MDSWFIDTTDPELRRVVEAIVECADPIEVVLFGSQARAEPTPVSDFDLLVVMPDGTPARSTTGVIYQALAKVPGRTRGVDIVVTDTRGLDQSRGQWWSVLDSAGRDGRSLYRHAHEAVPTGA